MALAPPVQTHLLLLSLSAARQLVQRCTHIHAHLCSSSAARDHAACPCWRALQGQAQEQMGQPPGDSRLTAEAILHRLCSKLAAAFFSACPVLPCAALPLLYALPCEAARMHAHWAAQCVAGCLAVRVHFAVGPSQLLKKVPNAPCAVLLPAGIVSVGTLMGQPCQAATAVLAEVACQLNDPEFATRHMAFMSCELGHGVATRSAASGSCGGGVLLGHALLRALGFTSCCRRPALLQPGGRPSPR